MGSSAPVIDAHIHFTPPSMAKELRAVADVEPYWGLLATPDKHNHTEQGWATAERTIEDMDAAGIDRSILLAEYRQNHGECVKRNDQSIEIIQRWSERITAFACIQPISGKSAIDELERCLAAGMAGVGELNPYGQGYSLTDPNVLDFMGYCEERAIPVNLHVSEPIGHYYFGKATTPLMEFWELARRFPDLQIILAHWGGGLFLYEIMPDIKRDLRNVHYDMAGSPLLYPTDRIFTSALACIEPEKLLYASDYPLLIVPEEQDEPDFRPFLREIEAVELEADAREAIMGGNAERLLSGTKRTREGERAPQHSYTTDHVMNEVTSISPDEKMISEFASIAIVAEVWPETRSIFERHKLPWRNSPVPFWEPIAQSAAARGMTSSQVDSLLGALNDEIQR